MTKTITLILVALFSVACGGEPFAAGDAELLAGAGGDATEAGSVGVTSGGSDVHVGGSSSVAGKPAGGSAGTRGGSGGAAGAAGGSGGAGAPAGGAPVTCEFDVTQLTAALPSTITWNDFTYTNGEACFACRDKPCGTIKVISWGVPTLQDGQYVYLPNTELPMIPMNIGVNDGACTKTSECGSKLNSLSLAVTVDETKHVVVSAHGGVVFQDNMCTTTAGVNTAQMALDLGQELGDSMKGLKIPCAP